MSAQDALWLVMDRPNNLMVVDSVVVLADELDVDAVRQRFRDAVTRFPVLARRPVRVRGRWCWTDDIDFDINRHVRAVELPGDAGMAALQEFVGEQRSVPLDMAHPLWVAFLAGPVDLPDGARGSAVVTRFHHAIADGVRLTQLLLGMCDAVEGAVVPRVVRSPIPSAPAGPFDALTEAVSDLSAVSRSALSAAAGQVGSALASVRLPRSADDAVGAVIAAPGAVRDAIDWGLALVRNPDRIMDAYEGAGGSMRRSVNDVNSVTKLVMGGSSQTIWTGVPGEKKSVSWSPAMPLAPVKAFAKANGYTINDVLVDAVAGGLRRYLDDHGARADDVIWLVPVNLKPFEEEIPEDLGNYFALVMLSLPLHHEDSEVRLSEIHARMQRIKNSDEPVITFGVQRTMSMSPQRLAEAATNFFANKGVGVLTNVPGPSGPMTFAGAQVRQVLGFAPCSGNQPLTATIFTYNGQVTIGFAADDHLVPELPRLVGHVVAEVGRFTAP